MTEPFLLQLSGGTPRASPAPSPITLFLVDDERLQRLSIAARLRTMPGFDVVAASVSAEEALRQITDARPDVVLLSLQQAGDDTLTLAGALHGSVPKSRVIIMGLAATHPDVAGLIRAGVAGFLMANASFDVLLETIRAVASGQQVLPAPLTTALFAQLHKYSVPGRPKRMLNLKQLTLRERQVADQIVLGLSNRVIGGSLGIALPTVKSHVRRVLSKLEVASRVELAALSLRGLVATPSSGLDRNPAR